MNSKVSQFVMYKPHLSGRFQVLQRSLSIEAGAEELHLRRDADLIQIKFDLESELAALIAFVLTNITPATL